MYESTRGNMTDQSAAQAIALGMVPEGGLFVPTEIPSLSWMSLGKDYSEIAYEVFKKFLPDFPEELIIRISNLYLDGRFESENPAPLADFGDFGVLELWHGPTSAFKDMALQVLPYLLSHSLKATANGREALILTATSGDTGKAALEGFKDVDGTKIVVFYPDGGVSPVQEKQMITTGGNNTYVVAVEGNFDQCQTAVKEIFASAELRQKIDKQGMIFSSANSINWGRLLPQIIYYVWAYLQAVRSGRLQSGDSINIVVPTGNFGNILAAYYAKAMGIPIADLICASNKNNVLTDFFSTGIYDTHRPFYLTNSPSMDILISSNFERFLYEMTDRDGEKIRHWFEQLKADGRFEVDAKTKERAQIIKAGWADEPEVLKAIGQVYRDYNYVLDPHTAVGFKVYQDYLRDHEQRYTVIASTASPYKFAKSVLQGLSLDAPEIGEWEALNKLEASTGWPIPQGLRGLEHKAEQKVFKLKPQEISSSLLNIINE